MTDHPKKADHVKAPVVRQDDEDDLTPTPTQDELDRMKAGTYHDRQMKAD